MPMGPNAGFLPLMAARGGAASTIEAVLNILLLLGVILGIVVICTLALYVAKRHARAEPPVSSEAEADQLATYRRMRDEGLLSEREYTAIREKLASRTKQALNMAAAPKRSGGNDLR